MNSTGAASSIYHILDGCDKSLQRLQMDHIDIYFLHRPDFSVPVEETLEALDIPVKQGRVKIHCLFDLSRLENHRNHVVNYFNTAEWMK